MSYMGLFWETGMPEAWTLSRKSGEKPMIGAAAECWPQSFVDWGPPPAPTGGLPRGDVVSPAPRPDDRKTKD